MHVTYVFVKDGKKSTLPAQAKAILNIVKAFRKVDRDILLTHIRMDIKSKQKPERLLTYFKRELIEGGYIEEIRHV